MMMDNQTLNQDNNNNNGDDNNDNGGSSKERKRIKLDDGNDTGVGNIRDINITFYCVWRNIVIRNEILFHTRLFNIHLDRSLSFTLEELSTYKYRGYLDMVYIRYQKIDEKETPLLPNVIPCGVSDVIFNLRNLIFQENSIPNTVTTIRFIGNPIKQVFTKGILPDSITCLRFGFGSSLNQSLAGGWLPSSLESLSLPRKFQHDIEVSQLPESLTELNFKPYSDYKGKTELGSIPSTVAIPLEYIWKCECKELTDQEPLNVPISTIKFGISKYIKEGEIPHNAISINFLESFNGEIQGALPTSLKSLEFGYSQNVSIIANVLSSSNLTSIDMGGYNLPLVQNLFPQSIISIKFDEFSQPIPEGYFYNYTNLKSLKFIRFNQVIPKKTLPPSLTSLKLSYYTHTLKKNVLSVSLSTLKIGYYPHTLNINVLPPSLTSLKLGYYNNPFNVNVLPSSLSTLKLGSYPHPLNVNALPNSLTTFKIGSSCILGSDQKLPSSITSLSIGTGNSIPVGSLPCNLKVLYINGSNFNQDLTEEGILPNSIQSIYFNHNIDKNYINNLDVDFFKKYIRFIK